MLWWCWYWYHIMTTRTRFRITIEAVKSKKELRTSVSFLPSLWAGGDQLLHHHPHHLHLIEAINHHDQWHHCGWPTCQQAGWRWGCQTSGRKTWEKLEERIIEKGLMNYSRGLYFYLSKSKHLKGRFDGTCHNFLNHHTRVTSRKSILIGPDMHNVHVHCTLHREEERGEEEILTKPRSLPIRHDDVCSCLG